MGKQVNFDLEGDLQYGGSLIIRIEEDSLSTPGLYKSLGGERGRFPPNPQLLEQYDSWQARYKNAITSFSTFELRRLPTSTNVAADEVDREADRQQAYQACQDASEGLLDSFHSWLSAVRLTDDHHTLESFLAFHLRQDEEIRIVLKTNDYLLKKLPWQKWHLLENYPQAGVIISPTRFKSNTQVPSPQPPVNILVILGEETERAREANALQDLEQNHDVEITWLEQPTLQDLDAPLWTQPWDIIFFFGHGGTTNQGQTGTIQINSQDCIEVSQLKQHLKQAINQGLQLVIISACDGLGIAHQLAAGEELHLYHSIIMQELLPFGVAPSFVQYFLEEFIQGVSLSTAIKKTRSRLQILEQDYPCASWLPMVYSNPAASSLRWQDLGGIPPCPYLGLSAFREEDAPFFFGRDKYTDRLVEAVAGRSRKPLVALIGDSGSGKSSLVKAGLIPRLRESQTKWLITVFKSGNNPFASLASALMQLEIEGEQDRRTLQQALEQDKQALSKIVEDTMQQFPDARFLLVADQFEELYTLYQDREKRRQFLELLLDTVNNSALFTLVLTLRVDFYGHALSYRPFSDALQDAIINLGPMNEEELQQAIACPARQRGVHLETELVRTLVNDIGRESGNLPLLQFTLTQLWQKQERGRLTQQAYAEIGGVESALADYADRVYTKLVREFSEGQIKQVFMQLVVPGEETGSTRRIATRKEIGENNWQLITKLADARLVITGWDETREVETVEIVHEALIHYWSKLKQWIKENKEKLIQRQKIEIAAKEWRDKHYSRDCLFYGKRLTKAKEFKQKYDRHFPLSPLALDFIEVSRKNNNNLLLQRLVILAIVIVSSSLVIYKLIGSREKHQLQILQASQTIIDNSWENIKKMLNQPGKNVLSLLESVIENANLLKKTTKIAKINGQTDLIEYPQFISTYALQQAIEHFDRSETKQLQRSSSSDPIWSVSFNPNGKFLVTGGWDRKIYLWDSSPKVKTPLFSGVHDSIVTSVNFSPDGNYVATATQNSEIRLWQISEQQKTLSQQWKQETQQDGILSAHFSPDGQTIATAGWDGTVHLWDLSGQEIGELAGSHQEPIRSVSFSYDGKLLATAGEDGQICLWNLNAQLGTKCWQGHQSWIWSVNFSPDGKLLATAGEDGLLRLWNQEGDLLYQFDTQQDEITSAIFSPDGETIATAGWDGTVRLWARPKPHRKTRVENQLAKWDLKSPVTNLSFSSDERDGRKIAAVTLSGQLIIKTVDELDELLNRACKLLKESDTEPQKLEKLCPNQ